jgi:hypothetical protein
MFGTVKGLFGFRKAGYRGLKKNLAKLWMLFAGANLLKYAWAGCPDWKPAVRGRERRGRSPGCGRKGRIYAPPPSVSGKKPDSYRPSEKTFVPGTVSVFESR